MATVAAGVKWTNHGDVEGRAVSTQQDSERICALTNVQNIRTVFSECQLDYSATLVTFTGVTCVH